MQEETSSESGLDAVLLQELYPRTDTDDTQLEIDLSDLDQPDSEPFYATFDLFTYETTGTFVRLPDTTHDHVVTVKFPFAALDAETQPVPLIDIVRPVRRMAVGTPMPAMRTVAERPPVYSAPYEKVEIERSFVDALPFPIESLPFERVELDMIDAPKRPRQETQIIDRGTSTITVVAVMICLMALSVASVLLLMR